jgi:hypothetical protein
MGGPVPNPFKSKPKAQEQPQVQAQMDAPKPASVPAGPTAIEMTDQRLIDARRRGRRANTLTGASGPADTLSLGYKSLLG